jgi:cytidyltransferase-like protein
MHEPKKVVICTGGFDPVHSGHINYFAAAKKLGDILIVGINSDKWLIRKKGRPFMPITERLCIINRLDMVDACLLFDDSDNTATDAIKKVKELYPTSTIIFANGGDRVADNIPEMLEPNVEFVFGVGGDKTASSSDFLTQWLNASDKAA